MFFKNIFDCNCDFYHYSNRSKYKLSRVKVHTADGITIPLLTVLLSRGIHLVHRSGNCLNFHV